MKPSTVDDLLDRCISEITTKERLLPWLLRKAAHRKNLNIADFEIQLLADAILCANGNSIQIDIDPPCSLGQTEKEVEESVRSLLDELRDRAEKDIATITTAVTEAIPQALAATAGVIGERLTEQSLEHATELQKIRYDRAKTVDRLWGKTLDHLDFLRQLVVEWAFSAEQNQKGSYSKPHTAIALHKLIERAFDVVGEVIVLARAGYADGALARWRTLHEICVISVFLSRQSDQCAEMYLAHHVVEKLKLVADEKAVATALTMDHHQDRYVRDLRTMVSTLTNRFGVAFAGDYGWASVALGAKKTTFKVLEQHVGLDILRKAYKKANSTVHGGALASLTRISLDLAVIENTDIPLEHGCEIAANYAAASLSMLVAELCLDTESADLLTKNMVIQNFASHLREEIEKTWQRLSNRTPRARILERKAATRNARTKRKVAIHR